MGGQDWTFLLFGIGLPLVAAVIVPLMVYPLYLQRTLKGAIHHYSLEGIVVLVMANGDVVLRPRSLANALGVLMCSVLFAASLIGALAALVIEQVNPLTLAFMLMIAGLSGLAFVVAWRGLSTSRLTFSQADQVMHVGKSRGVEAMAIRFDQLRRVVVKSGGDEWLLGIETDTDSYYLGRSSDETTIQAAADEIASLIRIDVLK